MNLNSVKVPKMSGGGAASALIKLGVIVGLGVYGVTNSLYNVDGGHRAIVFNHVVGVKDKVYPEGRHFMIPWFERPVISDARSVFELRTGKSEKANEDTPENNPLYRTVYVGNLAPEDTLMLLTHKRIQGFPICIKLFRKMMSSRRQD